MRILISMILGAGTILAAAPGQTQTHDPAYPVCLQTYGIGGNIECRYTSLAQCAMSASGHAAQCVVNPFSPHPSRAPPVRAHGRRAH